MPDSTSEAHRPGVVVDREHHIDQRDLAILDALVAGESPRSVATRFSVGLDHVRDLWNAREASE